MSKDIPESVRGDVARELYENTNGIRGDIKAVAAEVDRLRVIVANVARTGGVTGEVPANATLAYRHLEDASMRLGKVLQALDGGVSVYDRATTVGA